jgi:hypothetical protein
MKEQTKEKDFILNDELKFGYIGLFENKKFYLNQFI